MDAGRLTGINRQIEWTDKAIANRNVFEATIQAPPGFFVRLNFVENVSKK